MKAYRTSVIYRFLCDVLDRYPRLHDDMDPNICWKSLEVTTSVENNGICVGVSGVHIAVQHPNMWDALHSLLEAEVPA